jgi:hypothetical protein
MKSDDDGRLVVIRCSSFAAVFIEMFERPCVASYSSDWMKAETEPD